MKTLTQKTIDEITADRDDISIDWENIEHYAKFSMVPVTADIEGEAMKGNMRIEYVGNELDYFVGDWESAQ